jgi:hypothetical protein
VFCKPLSRRLSASNRHTRHPQLNECACLCLQAIIAYLGTFPDLCAQYAMASLSLGKVHMVHVATHSESHAEGHLEW